MKHFKSAGSVTLIVVLVALISFIYDWGSAKQQAQYDEAASVWAVAHTDWRAGPDLPTGSAIVAEVELPADVGILEEEENWTESYSCGTKDAPRTCSRSMSDWDVIDEARPLIEPAKNDSYNFIAPNVVYPEKAWYDDDLRFTGWQKGQVVTLMAHRIDSGVYLEHICGYSPADCVETLSQSAKAGTSIAMWFGIIVLTLGVFLVGFFLVVHLGAEYLR